MTESRKWHAICNIFGVPIQVRHIKLRGELDKMKNTLLKLYIKVQSLLSQEEGQDLVEYALVVALIALAATTGMSQMAGTINTAFGNIGTLLSSNIS
jgi:pilus assembly protein Flp/PilA